MFPITDTQHLGKFPLVNLGLILFTVYVFFLELISPDINLFIAKYALIPANIDLANSQTLTPFITSIFLHAGFLHIISNMWFLWVFGDNVEAKMGHIKYLIFYIFCGALASFTQYIFTFDTQLPIIGASGAIAGVLGAYLKYFPKHKIETIIPVFGLPLILPLPANIMLIYWFITQAFNGVASIVVASASVGGIAYSAHSGGFAAGYIFSRFLVWQRNTK